MARISRLLGAIRCCWQVTELVNQVTERKGAYHASLSDMLLQLSIDILSAANMRIGIYGNVHPSFPKKIESVFRQKYLRNHENHRLMAN